MNIYNLLKYIGYIRSPRLKLFGLWCAHLLGKRYIGIYIDPILGCNYRCQMCYYSNEEIRHKKRGRMTSEQLQSVAQSIFARTLKLQIGCGAEPTLDMNSCLQLIKLGRNYGVPYISMTTNGILLSEDKLLNMAAAGLNELTISLHGISRSTYEKMMGPTADYNAFLHLLEIIKNVKLLYPELNIRVNYTMNADNVDELADFDTLFKDVSINQLQLRPIRKIGDSVYDNFDLSHVAECLDTIIKPLAERCIKQGIIVLLPERNHLEHYEAKKRTSARERLLSLFTYHHIDAQEIKDAQIQYGQEDYNAYCRRTHLSNKIWKAIWCSEDKCSQIGQGLSNALNYDIR